MLDLNKVYCGDCLEVMKGIDNNSIDLTVTSPPYDNLRDYKGYTFNFENIAKELYRVTKNGGIVVWVVGDQTKNFCESLTSFKQAIYFKEVCGFNLLDTMIYKKRGGPSTYPNLKRYSPRFEYMFILSREKPKTFNGIRDHLNIMREGELNSSNTARQKDGTTKKTGSYFRPKHSLRSNVWEYKTGFGHISKDKITHKHPAPFPEDLAKDHIISWSNEKDIILDPMCGSGTTCKMAKMLNRNFIGIEISQEYCDIANKRLDF